MKQALRVIFIVIMFGLVGGCLSPTESDIEPFPKVPTQDLLLPLTAFSAKWKQSAPEDDDDYLFDDIETFSTQFAHQLPYPNFVTQRISRFTSTEKAADKLRSFVKANENPSDVPHRRQLAYHSQVADQQIMLCAYDRPPPEGPNPRSSFCVAYIQYGPYVVHLSAYIDDHSLSYADFEHILQAIDTQMEVVVRN